MDKFIDFKQSEYTSDKRYLNEFNNAVQALKNRRIFMNESELIIKKEHVYLKA